MAGRGMGCGIAVGAVGLLAVIGIVAIASGGSSSPSGPSRACAESYPDKQPKDVCADASGAVNFSGLVVTVSPFKSVSDQFLGKSICSDVAIQNTSAESQDYNELDFKIQTPNGDVGTLSAQGIGANLGSGTLVAGGTKSGKICADDKGQAGQFVFIYKPNPFEADRGIWLFTR